VSVQLPCESLYSLELAKAMEATTNTRAIFLLAAKKEPHFVYCNPFYKYAGFGNVFKTDEAGGMIENVQNYPYLDSTAIHGMAFDSTETYLYSADMWADRVWCHKKDKSTGLLELVGSVESPEPGDHPRWVAIHPSGKFLYVLMEAGNVLRLYSIDEKTHMPVYTTKSYPLVPSCEYINYLELSDSVSLVQEISQNVSI
jgi:carboxy-cis,cis-muconate cyclase